jgi:hypothetical protein
MSGIKRMPDLPSSGCGKLHIWWCGRGNGRKPVTSDQVRLLGYHWFLDFAMAQGSNTSEMPITSHWPSVFLTNAVCQPVYPPR